MDSRKEEVLCLVEDLVRDLMHEDRKNCESIPCGEIQARVEDNVLTIDDMVNAFEAALRTKFPGSGVGMRAAEIPPRVKKTTKRDARDQKTRAWFVGLSNTKSK